MGTGGSNYFLEPQRYDNNNYCDKTTYNQVFRVERTLLSPRHLVCINRPSYNRLQIDIPSVNKDSNVLVKIQKRFMRIISLNKYNAHTEPLFKLLELLSIKHLFDLSCLKFVYKFKQGNLPNYFLTFKCIPRSSIHEHNTRYSSLIDAEGTRTVIAGNCIRHHLVTVVNNTPKCIIDKIDTHSLHGFSFYIKRNCLNQLTYDCNLRECYVCGHLIVDTVDDHSPMYVNTNYRCWQLTPGWTLTWFQGVDWLALTILFDVNANSNFAPGADWLHG